MSTTLPYKCYPAAAAGIARAAAAGGAFANSTYTEVVPVTTITATFFITAVTLAYPNTLTVDTTVAVELELATGLSTAEVPIIVFPFNLKIDSAVGHQPVIFLTLTEPFQVAANTRISVRIRQSLAAATAYDGIKIQYYGG